MSDLDTVPRSGTGEDRPTGDRTITRRRTLPGGRAVAGALLITAAAVGVFAAWLEATATPSTTYLVATRDIAPGTRVTADHLRAVAIDLPPAQAAAAVTDPAAIVDRAVLAPVAAGDLLRRSDFPAERTLPGTTTFTFAIPSARALAGGLVPGDSIDVIATYGDTTGFVARAVPVLSTQGGGGTGGLLVTVGVADPATVLDIANALDTGQVHLARTDPDASTDDDPAPVTAPLDTATETPGGG